MGKADACAAGLSLLCARRGHARPRSRDAMPEHVGGNAGSRRPVVGTAQMTAAVTPGALLPNQV